MNTNAQTLEAVLFAKAEPMRIEALAQMLNMRVDEMEPALTALSEQLAGRGVRLLQRDDTVQLVTAPEHSEILEQIAKEELEKELGKAGLETLTMVLYNAPVSRAHIDYIRGVNSTYILRHLLVRGLIEKTQNPRDKRSYLYKPTLDVLRYLGITRVEELPEYATVQNELAHFFDEHDESASAE